MPYVIRIAMGRFNDRIAIGRCTYSTCCLACLVAYTMIANMPGRPRQRSLWLPSPSSENINKVAYVDFSDDLEAIISAITKFNLLGPRPQGLPHGIRFAEHRKGSQAVCIL